MNQTARADFGVIGLGVMGANIALNIADHGYPVVVWNRTKDRIDAFLRDHAHSRVVGEAELGGFVRRLERPRRILLMIQAGQAVDAALDQLVPLLEPEDIVIDGGNSWFEDTERRESTLAARGIRFFGMGISGGEEGARRGPSLMPGGRRESYERLRPVLESVAARSDSGPCVTWIGPGGAGHFVKMVHNGIEYGDMQLIAEAYDVLRKGLGLAAPAIADVFARWNSRRLESFLVELTARVLRVTDAQTGRPLVDLVLDKAGQKGTGRWTARVALDLGVPVPTIAAALDGRVLSSMKEERVAAVRLLGSPGPPAPTPDTASLIDDLERALIASKICSYAQGMALIRRASDERGWSIDLRETSRIWKGGCIIRAAMLNDMMRAFETTPALDNLLLDPALAAVMSESAAGWRRTLAFAIARAIPVPAFSASLAYFDAYRSRDLPQNLTQAQRDAFGAHTYQRTDDPKGRPVHSDWIAAPPPRP